MKHSCLGCQLANQVLPVHMVYEDEWVSCFLDHDPFHEGHVLILPKRHIEEVEELDEQTAAAIMHLSQRLAKAIKTLFQPDGITICQNGGIFSELTHYHMHAVPRYQQRSFALFYSDEPLDNAAERARLAETCARLRQALQ